MGTSAAAERLGRPKHKKIIQQISIEQNILTSSDILSALMS
jgi:hypothetical protein